MFTIRRGKRTDCVALQALLFPEDSGELSKAAARHWRRLAQDPAHDFSVAERDGTLWGMLLVSYVRALRSHGWQAVLDTAVLQTASPDIGRALLRFAKERARKRGCQVLTCSAPSDQHSPQMLLELLIEDGFQRSGAVLHCSLV